MLRHVAILLRLKKIRNGKKKVIAAHVGEEVISEAD